MPVKLGVNIDHIATLRNARGEGHPDLLKAAHIAIKNGANSLTIHVREDQRHVKFNDAVLLKKKIKSPINLEMAPTKQMTNFAVKLKPKYVCIVPEKRREVTTEGGLNLKNKNLKTIIKKLKASRILVSLFINPEKKTIIMANSLGVDAIELHTGNFARAIKRKNKKLINLEFNKIKNCKFLCDKTSMKFNLGHGLDYVSAKYLMKIKRINEFNIGHFIIGESVFEGLGNVVKKFKKILK